MHFTFNILFIILEYELFFILDLAYKSLPVENYPFYGIRGG